ncbi:MAG: AmmeMemoRadiSam system protein B [Endomicrobiales bacterium]
MKLSVFALLFLSCVASCEPVSDIRQPAVAGQFYPGDKAELTRMVDGFFSLVPHQNVTSFPVALLVPHAGYVYSGQVAAYSYALLDPTRITTVILIGNSHHFLLRKGAVYASGSFATPLGTVPIDSVLTHAILAQTPLLTADTAPHKPEHSLEVQLPFLQRKLKKFSIVPILMGNQSLEDCHAIGQAVAAVVRAKGLSRTTVIIASSDMSHYPSWANANMADTAALKSLVSFDPPQLKNTIDGLMSSSIPNEECVFCGQESVFTVMYAAHELGAQKVQVLTYANAGDVTGDHSRVVGYGAAVFLGHDVPSQSSQKPIAREATMNDFSVTRANQTQLLRTARSSIEQYLQTGKYPTITSSDPQLSEPAAVFVTLTKHGDLRGCIGTTQPQAPLETAVSRMAIAAAVEDYRFSPVTADELKDIHIEISVLSPMKRISNPDEIRQNVNGVVVRKGTHGGLFLPQVWEHFSTKKDFMDELCRQKAGLAPDAWNKPDTELYIFTVFAFEDPQ